MVASGGVCLLARMAAIDSKTNVIISTDAAGTALKTLQRYEPRILKRRSSINTDAPSMDRSPRGISQSR